MMKIKKREKLEYLGDKIHFHDHPSSQSSSSQQVQISSQSTNKKACVLDLRIKDTSLMTCSKAMQ